MRGAGDRTFGLRVGDVRVVGICGVGYGKEEGRGCGLRGGDMGY